MGRAGETSTKWFEDGILSSGHAELLLTLEVPAQVASYQLYTANDVPARDPVSWRLERQEGSMRVPDGSGEAPEVLMSLSVANNK